MNSLISLIDMMLLKVVAGMTAELLPYRGTQSQEVSLYLDFIILVSQAGKKKNFWEHIVGVVAPFHHTRLAEDAL